VARHGHARGDDPPRRRPRIVRHMRKRSLTITGVKRATTGTVSVKAVSDSGVSGAAARARVRVS